MATPVASSPQEQGCGPEFVWGSPPVAEVGHDFRPKGLPPPRRGPRSFHAPVPGYVPGVRITGRQLPGTQVT